MATIMEIFRTLQQMQGTYDRIITYLPLILESLNDFQQRPFFFSVTKGHCFCKVRLFSQHFMLIPNTKYLCVS
ncbi:hypothetical protein MtrunA17_Chr8g0334371 [Medicago truncatula]|uniref:Uncharacterized protein n=1 Tax=Medicago truncatula TaxID=3880 RepID=Q1STP1_MEDTR|nr:hypothetical protein MtrDRAFT_AC136139g20v2 [Medicago truncatula]RHN38545.1 hypothetical protein MtrunA17_Chr8g0334371 [Medicago truncatula]